jgi:uncharacterized membrane protein
MLLYIDYKYSCIWYRACLRYNAKFITVLILNITDILIVIQIHLQVVTIIISILIICYSNLYTDYNL